VGAPDHGTRHGAACRGEEYPGQRRRARCRHRRGRAAQVTKSAAKSAALPARVDIAAIDFEAVNRDLQLLDPPIGSNGWAFGKAATADGSGLLLGNPHFPGRPPTASIRRT
jgi:acyl-homoserine lactone acylase PvdQ